MLSINYTPVEGGRGPQTMKGCEPLLKTMLTKGAFVHCLKHFQTNHCGSFMRL